MLAKLKHGDIIKTGNASTIRSFRITKLATPDDLRYLSRIQTYLIERPGRQPPVSFILQIIEQLAAFEKSGKIVPVVKKSHPKILNPATGRYVLKDGKIGRALLKKK